MSQIENSRLPQWTQPQRPDWVRQINEEALHLDARGIVPLDEESLIATARRNTGLSDFGDDDWRGPFRALIEGIDAEAELTMMGRILTRSDLLMLLEARLRVEDMYRRHPEIEDEVIDRPFFIIGQGRSGSTLLQKLLGLPPENRTMTDLDGIFPVLFDGLGEAERREIAQNRMRQWSRIVPQVAPIHDFSAESPCETIRFEAYSFRCPAWLNLLGITPSYNGYLAGQDVTLSLGYAKRVLKVMQWQRPGFQWVLKSPDALLYLPDVLKVFPDARFVWGHRDPIKALSSMVDMIGTMTFIRSDRRMTNAYEAVTNPAVTSAMMSKPIDWLESGALPKAQLCNIQYKDLIADPVGTVASIYAFHGVPFSDAAREAIATYSREHPRSNRPSHGYSHGDEEQIRAERDAFRRYQEYFAVPNEF